ncbi:ATP synthase mitochondrial F1 complex assembly factor 1 isoform X5 [Stigmatopora argus]
MLHKNDGKMAAALLQMTCTYRGLLAIRVTGIRTLIPGLVPVQFRAFSVRKEPKLEDNPYYFKYQEKIQKMCSSRPQEFKARMEKSHKSKTKMLGSSKQADFVRAVEQQLKKQNNLAAENKTSRSITKNKTLGSILNLERIQDKTGEEIAEIWTKHYATKDTISAVIPRQTYEIIATRAQSCPMFLYALPQNEGYEFFVGQWSSNMLNFTSLINIQDTMEIIDASEKESNQSKIAREISKKWGIDVKRTNRINQSWSSIKVQLTQAPRPKSSMRGCSWLK